MVGIEGAQKKTHTHTHMTNPPPPPPLRLEGGENIFFDRAYSTRTNKCGALPVQTCTMKPICTFSSIDSIWGVRYMFGTPTRSGFTEVARPFVRQGMLFRHPLLTISLDFWLVWLPPCSPPGQPNLKKGVLAQGWPSFFCF